MTRISAELPLIFFADGEFFAVGLQTYGEFARRIYGFMLLKTEFAVRLKDFFVNCKRFPLTWPKNSPKNYGKLFDVLQGIRGEKWETSFGGKDFDL